MSEIIGYCAKRPTFDDHPTLKIEFYSELDPERKVAYEVIITTSAAGCLQMYKNDPASRWYVTYAPYWQACSDENLLKVDKKVALQILTGWLTYLICKYNCERHNAGMKIVDPYDGPNNRLKSSYEEFVEMVYNEITGS